MTDQKSPQERIVAARRLYAVLREYLDRPTWTPVEGALIVSGMNAPVGCAEFPHMGGTGLDGRPYGGDVFDRWLVARDIVKQWQWRCEDDEENGNVTPTTLTPYEFIAWCQDMGIESDWLRLFFEVITGDKVHSGRPDLVSVAVAEYTARIEETLGAVQALVGQVRGASSTKAPLIPKSLDVEVPRGPMPIPTNRDYLTTDELARVLAVEPQSIRKAHSKNGRYQGIRPTKLPNRQLMWPAEQARSLLAGNDSVDN